MIRDFPLTGVGLGTYHTLVSTYSAIHEARYLPSDNAQNWYRHELAEMGVLGSIGWIVWCCAFLVSAWKTRGARRQLPLARVVFGAIMLLAVISLVGIPTQDVAMALTFWVLVFWYTSLIGQTVEFPGHERRLKWWHWLGAWGIVGAFALGTGYVAVRKLRVPYRAQSVGWNYTYGFYSAEPSPDGGSFRYTAEKAVDVFEVKGPWLKLTIRGAVPPDAVRHGIVIKVWRGPDSILRIVRRDNSTMTRYIRAPRSPGTMMVEIQVSRTWRPVDFGGDDSRDLGVGVDEWTWVNAPPRGGITID